MYEWQEQTSITPLDVIDKDEDMEIHMIRDDIEQCTVSLQQLSKNRSLLLECITIIDEQMYKKIVLRQDEFIRLHLLAKGRLIAAVARQ